MSAGKRQASKWRILIYCIVFCAMALSSAFLYYRIDLTKEKRFTFSASTHRLISQLQEPVYIDVFLTGELSSGLKKVRSAVDAALSQYRSLSGGNIIVRYTDVFKLEDEDEQRHLLDSLSRFGLSPLTQVAQEKKGSVQSQRLVLPGALVQSVNGVYPVNFLAGVSTSDESSYYNNIESLLEYKFSSAIDKVTRDSVPHIAYLTGNGQPLFDGAFELLTILAAENSVDTLNIKTTDFIPEKYNAVIILQPTQTFTASDKLKIDQYLIHGGNVLIATDILEAPLDSLKIQGSALAFDNGLELTDLLFKYGVRINPNLVLDYQNTDIPQVVGDVGGKPQIQLLSWPYYPLVQGTNHPISKNLDPVFLKYASSIDTVKTIGATKAVLLTTSAHGKIIASPSIISFNAMQYANDVNAFTQPYVPVAVLVEGSFNSLFANRIAPEQVSALANQGYNFSPSSTKSGRLITIADGDIFLNELSQKGMVPMGANQYVEYTFANKQFLLNCIDYMCSNTGIFESRSKNFTLRLLDAAKIETEKQRWQWINIAVPLLLIALFGIIFLQTKKRKYA